MRSINVSQWGQQRPVGDGGRELKDSKLFSR